MSRDIGFAVVGLGMGRHHCKAIQAAPGARLVAVCDLDEERRLPVAQEFGCRAYATVEELLADAEVEVVNIATPSGTHAALGARFAAAGKHLIVEKPADIVASRVDELLAAVRQHGVKAAGIFQSRLDPLNIRIRQAIQAGRLGTLIGAHGHLPWFRAQSYYEGRHGTWKGTWDMDGGGSLMNQGVHTVDLLQWLAGPVAAVMGSFGVFGHQIEAEDQTTAILRFANGALGTLYTTTCCYPGFNQRLTLYGTRGTIIKEEGNLHSWKLQDDAENREEQELLALYGAGRKASGAADPMAVGFDGHTQIVLDMIGAILEDREPLITLESAKHPVEIINAIYLSGRTGREVRVGEKPVAATPAPAAKETAPAPRTGHRKGKSPKVGAAGKAGPATYSKPSTAQRTKAAPARYAKTSAAARSKPTGYNKAGAGEGGRASGGYSKPSTRPSTGGYGKASTRPSTGAASRAGTGGYGKASTRPSTGAASRAGTGGYGKASTRPSTGGYDKPSTRPSTGGYDKASTRPSTGAASRAGAGGYGKASTRPSTGGYVRRPGSVGRSDQNAPPPSRGKGAGARPQADRSRSANPGNKPFTNKTKRR